LKVSPHFFEALATGGKSFELRREDDRSFSAATILFCESGAQVILRVMDTRGRKVNRYVSFILRASAFPEGLQPGYAVSFHYSVRFHVARKLVSIPVCPAP